MTSRHSTPPGAPVSMTQVSDPPLEVRLALSELIGFLLEEGSGAMHFNLDDVRADGRPAGRFEIVVQRL